MSNTKLFISYSHRDKILFDQFKTHLSMLKRNKEIDILSDREILAGDLLNEEILEDIYSSGIVSFLISSDFLNSDYCMDVEFENTINRYNNNGEVRILPIILRDCDWENSLFRKFKAIPEDGKPVVNFDKIDSAWKDVIKEIRRILNIRKKQININITPPELVDKFVEFLNDNEVEFLSSNKDRVCLDDVFVYPDLKTFSEDYDFESVYENSKVFLDLHEMRSNILILGDDQSGKTSLLKKLYRHYYENGKLPIYIAGDTINQSNIKRVISKNIKTQYKSIDSEIEAYNDIVIIIDDFHSSNLNSTYKKVFIDNISKSFNNIIVTSDSIISLDKRDIDIFTNYNKYELQPFGYTKRNELVEKWHSIGRKEVIEENELYSLVDSSAKHIDAIVGKNLLPPKPIYILSILQSLETSDKRTYSLTSYGHCYHSLIQSALMKENISTQDLDQFFNYLTELAYYMYSNESLNLSEKSYREFEEMYSEKYIIESHDFILNKLFNANILIKKSEKISFKYIYIYYFYTAKYICDHISNKKLIAEVEYLAANIHVEKNAYILIFLIHHSRDDKVIDEIILSALMAFDETEEATLTKNEVDFLAEFLEEIPELVVKVKSISDERIKRLKDKDKIEDLKKSYKKKVEENEDIKENDNKNESKVFGDINRSIRVIEVIGQILKNRYGSLDKKTLQDLTVAARSSGLKLLKYFLVLSKNEQSTIIDFISDQFREDQNIDEDVVSLKAKRTYTLMCFRVILGIIKKIANSIGSEKLKIIFESILDQEEATPAYKLVHLAFLLEFLKKIPKNEILTYYQEFEKNIINKSLLRELVVNYLYINHVDAGSRTWIADKLRIQMRDQRFIQSIETTKKIK